MKNLYKSTVPSCLKLLTFFALFFTLNNVSIAQESMRANLYVIDGNNALLMDGNLTEYNEAFSNNVDIYDAWKLSNFGMNLGILRSGYNLAVERRRTIKYNDTTFFRMWNMSKNNYRIRLVLRNLDKPWIRGYLLDNYLRTETRIGLNDTTDINFSVDNDPASASEMRFSLVFRSSIPVPPKTRFISLLTLRKNRDVLIKWDVANENEITNYIVERSSNGIDFSEVYRVQATSNNNTDMKYDHRDVIVPVAEQFYRVKALDENGNWIYSDISKVNELVNSHEITVFPNPVAGKKLQLSFNNMPAGKYDINIISNTGAQIKLQPLQLNEWQLNATINLPGNLAPGIYRLHVMSENKLLITKIISVL